MDINNNSQSLDFIIPWNLDKDFNIMPKSNKLSTNLLDDDTQTVISDITEQQSSSTENTEEFLQKKGEINAILDTELNKLNADALKDKCKELKISNLSKLKKQDLINLLLQEFEKTWVIIRNKKIPELKTVCKSIDIKGPMGTKKDILCYQIMTHCAANVIFELKQPENKVSIKTVKKEVDKKELTVFEELEKQQKLLDVKMKEELQKQKEQKEREQKEQLRLQEDIEKQQAELEKQKIEKQKLEDKKKKQSIPKNVRMIVWNHYIGEDIIKHRCLCCKKVVISNTNFEVGHVISEKNEGTHEINNLRPICFACNHSMGSVNMIDFVVKYGLYIG